MKEAELYNRAGNYILSFGHPGSGKTTFQNFLIRYLIEGTREFTVEPLDTDGEPAGNLLLSEWMDQWSKGELAPATETGNPKEYAFRVMPIGALAGKKPEFEFGFFEISGEDLTDVKITPGNLVPSLPDELEAFLTNPNINYVVVLVLDGENPDRDDKLFSDFLTYLEKLLGQSMYSQFNKKCPVLVLISKPQMAASALSRSYRKNPDLSGFEMEEKVVETFLPLTYGKLTSWASDFQIALLNIGRLKKDNVTAESATYVDTDVKAISGDDTVAEVATLGRRTLGGNPEENEKSVRVKMIQPDYDHIGKIFRWIYFTFTKQSPELIPPAHIRLWQYFYRLIK